MTEPAQLIEPRLPRGLEDRTPQDIAATEAMIARIKEVYRRYGFDPVETPLLEYTETLGKFLPDTDRPNAGVFSLRDDDEQWMSLRYDLTAPLARYFAQNYDRLPKPYRSYRQGYVFRNEKPGPGRFRQFMQFDADTVGAAGPEADAEMCMMMADTMDALGLAGKYVVRVNHRKLWDGALDALGVPLVTRLTVLRAIDKLDRIGLEGVRALLGSGRKDDSGDFTAGANISEKAADAVIKLLSVSVRPADWDDVNFFVEYAGLSSEFSINQTFVEALSQLKLISKYVVAAGYNSDRIKIDYSVVRGLEYYTGPVFEIELIFKVRNEKGEQVVFGSVGGGGRYDGLVSRFRADPVPATGFSIGVSRLAHALKLNNSQPAQEADGPVVVLVMDRDQVASYQAMVAELRRAGIRAEMYLGSSGMNAQMKYANRRNAPAVVIEGSNERAQGVLTIKDMIAGAEAARNFTDNAAMRAARPAQVNIPRADLVKTVRDIIGAGAQG